MKKTFISAFAVSSLLSAVALADVPVPNTAYVQEDSSSRQSVYATIVDTTGQTPKRLEFKKADYVTATAKVTCFKYDAQEKGTCLIHIQK